MRKKMGKILLAILGTAVLAGSAQAAEKGTSVGTDLDKVVITANRIANKKVDTPANVNVISAEEITSRGYQNVAEALDNVPGCHVLQNGGSASEKRIMLNGDLRVAVLVNGRRVNINMGTTSRASLDINTLPPVSMIERIEVMKGGASTLYGADAVGGVVNIITKKPEANQGKVSLGYGSMGRQEMDFSYGGKSGKTGYLLAVNREKQSYFKFRDKNGDTKHWPGDSNYRQDRVSLQLSQDFTKKESLTLNYDYSNMDGINCYSYTSKHPSFSDINKKTNNVALRYDWNRDEANSGHVTAYRNYFDYYNYGSMNERTYGFDVQQNFATSDTNKVILGAEYKNAAAENATSYVGTKGINTRAVFLQDQWQFAPTWQVNADLRYDNHSKAGSKTTGSIAFNKKFTEDSHAYLSWNQVFKAPTIDDLYYYYDDGTYKYISDENLKPETGDTWTIGYDFKTSPSTELSISAFYSNLKDAIHWHTADWFNYYAVNADKEKKRGLEISALHRLNANVDLTGSYTYAKVEDSYDQQTYSTAGYHRDYAYVPNLYRFGVRYHNKLWNVDLVARGASGLSKECYGESSYLTMDLNTRYKINDSVTAYLKLYNLTNASYAEQAGVVNGQDSYPMAGRSFIAGVEYKF